MSKRFAVITHTPHKIFNNRIYAYRPYMIEMNLWLNHVDECKVVAPLVRGKPTLIEDFYTKERVELNSAPSFNTTSFVNMVKSVFMIPLVLIKIFKVFIWADHIHLRCPGNFGLLGIIVQFFFPSKLKTVKYAGNWDPNSEQPFSYKLQKKLLSSTFFSQKCKVLVYGNWNNQTKNILPFFTATYHSKDIINTTKPYLLNSVNLIFVGQFTEGKQPLLAVKVCEEFSKKHPCLLNMYGDGALFDDVMTYIKNNNLSDKVTLHGKSSKEVVQKAFQASHFLIFISKSEGWPKVVAESMFWGCIPFSSEVSCVPDMLNHGERGELVDENTKDVVQKLENYIQDHNLFKEKSLKAMNWSRQFTLDKFEEEIKVLIGEEN